MNFKEKLDIIFESPDVMTIMVDGPTKGEQGSYGDESSITFGWYKGSLFTCGMTRRVLKDGKPLESAEIQKMLGYVYDDDSPIRKFIKYSSFNALSNETLPNSKDYSYTHSDLIVIVVQYFRLLKLHTFLSKFPNATEDEIYNAVQKIHQVDAKDILNPRSALEYAGRIFPPIQGISFWDKAPSKNKILELLRVTGQSPEHYIIEELEGRNQFPLDDRMFKTQGKEVDETELARKMLAQRIQKMKKQHYEPKKDIFTNFYSTVGG